MHDARRRCAACKLAAAREYKRRPRVDARLRGQRAARLGRPWSGGQLELATKWLRTKHHCDGCGCEVRGKNKVIDHDHASGLLRGVLCQSCNRGVGLLGDSVEKLLKLVAYLQRAGNAQ